MKNNIIRTGNKKLYGSAFVMGMLALGTLMLGNAITRAGSGVLYAQAASSEDQKPGIQLRPVPASYPWNGKKLETLPEPRLGIIDVRGYDLSALDLTGKENDFRFAWFDSRTKWPEALPKGFDPKAILEHNKYPGLGLKALHDKGITGKDINVAIIDYALLLDHVEFENRVKMYEHHHYKGNTAQMHGPGVASILAGKTTGVAPQANLYFIACENYNVENQKMEIDHSWTAKAIDRIIEVNKVLPRDHKIKVLSMSVAWNPSQQGYAEITAAVKRAVDSGIFVVSGSLFETSQHRYCVFGLDIDRLADKDDFDSYKVLSWEAWMEKVQSKSGQVEFYNKDFMDHPPAEQLMIPTESKTVAGATGINDYMFTGKGGWSWSVPYIAGLYALACQVMPDVTPELFWSEALKTGVPRKIVREGKEYAGKIVNPEKLIEALSRKKG